MGYLGTTYSTFDPLRTPGLPADADRFSGNGSTTIFTMTRVVDVPTAIEVFVNNVQQEPVVSYSVSATSLIFTAAPGAGSNNIYVVYRGFSGGLSLTVPDGSIASSKLANNIRLFTVDNFTANGTDTTFTLSETPAGANTVMVAVNGIVQTAPTNYGVSGTTLTFTSAPMASANVMVRHLGFRTTTTITALPAGTTLTQPILAGTATGTYTLGGTPTITAPAISAPVLSGTATGTYTLGGTPTISTNLTLGSSVLATPTGSAPAFLCRAWVNFNGTGAIVIRASGNVSSITDNGTGDYTVNFTTSMPDANYSYSGNCNNAASGAARYLVSASTANFLAASLRLNCIFAGDGSLSDSGSTTVSVFR